MRELLVCPICESNDRKLIYHSTLSLLSDVSSLPDPYSAHYQINECLKCNLRFSNPIFDEQQVNDLYCHSENGNIIDGENDNVRRTMQNYYKLVHPYVSRKDRVLDIGCDVGYFLEAALDDGFLELYGLEPTKPARIIAEKLPRSIISEKFYEQVEYSKNYFDLITMIHVLDHLVDPSIALIKAKNELMVGGLIFAVVHNSNSVMGVVMGEKFPVYNLYHHYFFTKQTLKSLFESKGFEVVKVFSTTNCYSLKFFVNKLPYLPNVVKKILIRVLTILRVSNIPINIPIGNIGILGRKIN